jgi:hypothetical protein
MTPDGAGSQGRIPQLAEWRAVAQIERDGDDIGVMLASQSCNGMRRFRVTAVREDDSVVHFVCRFTVPS